MTPIVTEVLQRCSVLIEDARHAETAARARGDLVSVVEAAAVRRRAEEIVSIAGHVGAETSSHPRFVQ